MKLKRIEISVRDMVFTALAASVLCVTAPFSLYIAPAIPLTFATLVIYVAGGALDWKCSTLAVVIYVLLGAVGLPVFSNFEGGFHKIAGMTGGYIIGYIPCVLTIGVIVKTFKNKIWSYAMGMVIGTVLLYTCGTAWFIFQTGNSLPAALTLCVIPFLPGDAMKIIIACVVAPQFRNALVL